MKNQKGKQEQGAGKVQANSQQWEDSEELGKENFNFLIMQEIIYYKCTRLFWRNFSFQIMAINKDLNKWRDVSIIQKNLIF